MPNSFVSFPVAQWYFVRFACSLNCCEKRGSLSKFNCYVKLKHISRAVPSPAPSLLPTFLRRILSRDKVAKSTQCLNKQQSLSLSLFELLTFVSRSFRQFAEVESNSSAPAPFFPLISVVKFMLGEIIGGNVSPSTCSNSSPAYVLKGH